MKYFTNFINKNPQTLSKYVSFGIKVSNVATSVLGKFMRHLLVVQNIDPNTQPGARARQQLVDALNKVEDKEAYDSDYDTSWVRRRFEAARDQLKHLNLDREKFERLTDVNAFGNAPIDMELNAMAPDSLKRELNIFVTEKDLNKEQDKVTAFISNAGSCKTEVLQEALNTLKSTLKERASLSELDNEIDENIIYDKITKAKELCDLMVKKGLVNNTKEAIDSQLSEILKFTDTAFNSLVKVVARHEGSLTEETPKTRISTGKIPTKFKGSFRRVSDK